MLQPRSQTSTIKRRQAVLDLLTQVYSMMHQMLSVVRHQMSCT